MINYGGGPSPDPMVRAYLRSGSSLDPPGIGSSVAAADPTHFPLGYGDGADGIISCLQPGPELIQYARIGDANMDGKVDFADLTILARHYGKTNATWDEGDFNYEGTVGFGDLVLLARNYGQSLSPAQLATFTPAFRAAVEQAFAEVPEPTPLSLLCLGSAILPYHPRRRSSIEAMLLLTAEHCCRFGPRHCCITTTFFSRSEGTTFRLLSFPFSTWPWTVVLNGA